MQTHIKILISFLSKGQKNDVNKNNHCIVPFSYTFPPFHKHKVGTGEALIQNINYISSQTLMKKLKALHTIL